MKRLAVKSDIYAPSVCKDLQETIIENAALAKMFDLQKPFELYERLIRGERLTTQEYPTAWILEQMIELWFEQNPQYWYADFEFCFEEVEA